MNASIQSPVRVQQTDGQVEMLGVVRVALFASSCAGQLAIINHFSTRAGNLKSQQVYELSTTAVQQLQYSACMSFPQRPAG